MAYHDITLSRHAEAYINTKYGYTWIWTYDATNDDKVQLSDAEMRVLVQAWVGAHEDQAALRNVREVANKRLFELGGS